MPAVAQELIDLLICPACHGEIEYKDRRKLIICTACDRRYPVRDGIPIMLIDEAEQPQGKADAGTDSES